MIPQRLAPLSHTRALCQRSMLECCTRGTVLEMLDFFLFLVNICDPALI